VVQSYFTPWDLRGYLYRGDPAAPKDPRANMLRVERLLCAFAAESAAADPGAHRAAQVRALYENVWQPPTVDRTGLPRCQPHSDGYFDREKCRWIAEEAKGSSPHTVYDVRGLESLGARFFRRWNQTYVWYYRGLLLTALLAGFAALSAKRAHPLLFTPILLFGVNVLFVTYLIMPYGRYIQVFDCLLALQVLFALSTLRRPPAAEATIEPA
jgi:hypothetical protein